VLKKLLLVLSLMTFVGMSAIITVGAVRTFYDLVLLQVEHDLMIAYPLP
jgi:hypothetical protein